MKKKNDVKSALIGSHFTFNLGRSPQRKSCFRMRFFWGVCCLFFCLFVCFFKAGICPSELPGQSWAHYLASHSTYSLCNIVPLITLHHITTTSILFSSISSNFQQYTFTFRFMAIYWFSLTPEALWVKFFSSTSWLLTSYLNQTHHNIVTLRNKNPFFFYNFLFLPPFTNTPLQYTYHPPAANCPRASQSLVHWHPWHCDSQSCRILWGIWHNFLV